MTDTPLTPRPEVRRTQQPAQYQVTARQNTYAPISPAQNGGGLMGLVAGLQSLNPELSKALETYHGNQREEAVEQARVAEAKDQRDPRDALTGAPVEVPEAVPPAFDDVYRNAYRNLRTQRAALSISQDIAGEYDNQKNSPDFNPKAFLSEKRQSALAGLSDPTQVGIMDSHLTQLEQRISADYQGLMVKRHEEERKTTMFTMTEQAMDPLMQPEDIAERGHWLVDQGATIQVLPQDAGRAIVRRVRSMAGDRPELFDAFDVPDANGLTLRAKFPELSEEIDTGRKQAQAARDKAVHEATETDRFDAYAQWNKAVDDNPEFITSPAGIDALRSQIGPNGFSAEKAASILDAAYTQVAKKKLADEATLAAQAGTLGRYSPEYQQKALEGILRPTLDAVWKTAAEGTWTNQEARASAIAQLAQQVMQVQTQTGATVPVEALARLLNSSVTALPAAEGPSPAFLASAEMYRAMEPNPQYRDLYFKDKASDLLRTYTRLAYEEGMAAPAAYEQAYFVHSPENKEQAMARVGSPAFAKELASVAEKAATGTTIFKWEATVFGHDFTIARANRSAPKNADVLRIWASMRARDVLRQNPQLTEDEVLKKVESMVGASFVYDSTSERAIEVPAGVDQGQAQAALSDLSESLTAKFRKENMIKDGGYVFYRKVPGDNDLYRVTLQDGRGAEKTLDQVSLSQIIDRYRAKMGLAPEEADKIRTARLQAQAGEPVDIDHYLLEKGKQTGMLSGEWANTLSLINAARLKATFGRLAGPAAFDLGKPSGDNTMRPRVDRSTTASQAMDFAFSSGLNSANHLDLAASLATVREGVMLSAYGDPAKGAGQNIGAGYNLSANAATADADLKAVGVPAERIPDVKAGKASLTSDQVKALTKLTVKRFEPQVMKAAEAAKPGLWQSLTPQQRAVMLDVAYQTGDAGSYGKAWAALAAGDGEAFRAELKTFYSNQKGERVHDARALDLRSSLLAGPSAWKARLMVASRADGNSPNR